MAKDNVISLRGRNEPEEARTTVSRHNFSVGSRNFIFKAEGCPSGVHLQYCLSRPVRIEAPEFLKGIIESSGVMEKLEQVTVCEDKVHRGGVLFFLPLRWRVRMAIARMKKSICKKCALLDYYGGIAETLETL